MTRVAVDASVCGCTGKLSLDDVVHPARRRVARVLSGSRLRLAGALDAALLPATADLTRRTGTPDAVSAGEGDRTAWLLHAALVSPSLRDPDEFAAMLRDGYRRAAGPGRCVVGKGHTVQVSGASEPRQWVESLEPRGAARPGYVAANVDLVHGFPGLDAEQGARVAALHALNDCYALGGVDDLAVRPVVATPADDEPAADAVRGWYERALPGATVLGPARLAHDGTGWLFGATATASVARRPPVRFDRVEPGDEVLLHRPLGGLALYVHALEASGEAVRDRALDALAADHRPVAARLCEFLPAVGEAFDADRHVSVATDISGPGVRGLAAVADRAGVGVRLTDLPFLDGPAVRRLRDRWTLPDATVETNGPLALVGRPGVLDALADRLADLPGADPRRVGRVVDGDGVTAAPGARADRYIEGFA